MLKVWRWTVECWDLYQKGLGNFDVLKFVLLCFGVFSISYSWIALEYFRNVGACGYVLFAFKFTIFLFFMLTN